MKIFYKKLSPEAIVPSYGTSGSAGADVYALSDSEIIIQPGETKLIHTGIALEIPEGYVGLVFARSGLASKRDLAPANKVGVIDSDYRGELMVPLHNHGSASQTVSPFERVAQLIIMPYIAAELIELEELGDTDRGQGGFGSTGMK